MWEGQFRKGKPSGFARFIEVSDDKKMNYCMGYWTDENHMNGYGMIMKELKKN
jgi:hypothetical protein